MFLWNFPMASYSGSSLGLLVTVVFWGWLAIGAIWLVIWIIKCLAVVLITISLLALLR